MVKHNAHCPLSPTGAHHYVMEWPEPGVYQGVCKYCGAVRHEDANLGMKAPRPACRQGRTSTSASGRSSGCAHQGGSMLRIEIPGLPPVACSPNARLHWAAKAKAASTWGSTVFYQAVDARNRTGEPAKWKNLDGAEVNVTFVLPNKRRRDVDNLIASFKSGLDALVRCGILVDDSAGHVTLTYAAKQGDDAQTIVEITPCEDK